MRSLAFYQVDQTADLFEGERARCEDFVFHGFLTFYGFKYVDFLADVKLFFDKKIGIIGQANPTPPSLEARVNPFAPTGTTRKAFCPCRQIALSVSSTTCQNCPCSRTRFLPLPLTPRTLIMPQLGFGGVVVLNMFPIFQS